MEVKILEQEEQNIEMRKSIRKSIRKSKLAMVDDNERELLLL